MFKVAHQFVNPPTTRARQLRKALRAGEEISEAVEFFGEEKGSRILCLLCLYKKTHISHIAWGRRGKRAATGLVRLNFEKVTQISLIDVDELVSEYSFEEFLPFFSKKHVHKSADESNDFIDALRRRFSEIDKFIGELESDFRMLDALTEHERHIVRQEEDAAEMSIRLADMTPRQVVDWSPTSQGHDKIESHFSGMTKRRLQEDDVIRYDLRRVPGYKVLLDEEDIGHYVLGDSKSKLHIFHANKNKLELCFGVDLIYFDPDHSNFVMIQYKMCEPQGNTHIFRFPSAQLTKEISRMNDTLKILDSIRESDQYKHLGGSYRINNDPFFLKFCPRERDLDPNLHEQIHGMIIPLGLWKTVEKDTENFLGPDEGRILSFDNCPRWFDNTAFISLVNKGWIGTDVSVGDFLGRTIREVIDAGRSLVFATKLSEISDVQATAPPVRKKRKTTKPKRRPRKPA